MRGLTHDERTSLLRSVGTHRNERLLSPAEVALLLRKSELAGGSRRDMADALDIGTTQVATFLRLLSLDPAVRDLAGWGGGHGTVAFSSLAQLSALRPADQLPAARAVLRFCLTWKEVVQLVQLQARTSDSLEESVKKVVAQRPQVETRHLYAGVVKPRSLTRALSQLAQRDRDALLRRVLQRLGLGDASGRLSADRFFITWQRDPAAFVEMNPDQFEAAVISKIEEELE